jgi:hypothetical protein
LKRAYKLKGHKEGTELRTKTWLGILTVLTLAQPACIVGGYRSGGGGWFLWPGGLLGVLIVIAIFFLITRGRR